MWPTVTDVAWYVRVSVCLSAKLPLVPLAKTDRTDRDVAWSVYLSKPKEADIRWGPHPPWEARTLREGTWVCAGRYTKNAISKGSSDAAVCYR